MVIPTINSGTMYVGQTFPITLRNANGSIYVPTGTVSWAMSPTDKGTIAGANEAASFTATAAGTVSIIATIGALQVTATITILEAESSLALVVGTPG